MSTPIRTDHARHLRREELARLVGLAERSIAIIEASQSSSGAYLASPTFPVYRYTWFRDGSFIADAMSRVGRHESAERFFQWCHDVLVSRSPLIESLLERRSAGAPIARTEFLPCRYTVDGEDVGEDWWEFQLDGYGTWLWALDQHDGRRPDSILRYRESIELTVAYLLAFWDEPCYDWWEEHPEHRHTSTLAALYAGLEAATRWPFLPAQLRGAVRRVAESIRARVLEDGVRDGHLVKWLGSDALDASLIACATPFRLVAADEPLMRETIRALESELAHGGVHRYATDTYYGGGEWVLLAALLGWQYAEAGRTADAYAQLRWVAEQANERGELPEQTHTHLLAPDFYEQWVDRWGPAANPLLWSHAMFLTLAHELGVVDSAEASQ